jgi:hypothetical protein
MNSNPNYGTYESQVYLEFYVNSGRDTTLGKVWWRGISKGDHIVYLEPNSCCWEKNFPP